MGKIHKIPYGLKLLSNQGQGTYDIDTGVWNIGNLQTGSATLELVLQAVDAGSMTNTATIYSDLPDLNTVNNQVNFGVVVNAPDLDSVPADDLNILPYTFPPDIIPTPGIPGVPLGSGGSGGSGYNGGSSPGPGSSEPKTQLQRDINYVRGTVGYNPTPDPVTNSTTPKPEMPQWTMFTDILWELAFATSVVAAALAGYELLKRDFGGLFGGKAEKYSNYIGGYHLSDWFSKHESAYVSLTVATYVVLLLSPPSIKDWVLLIYAITGMILYFGQPLHGAWGTNVYSILSLAILIWGFATLLKGIFDGKSVEEVWNESVMGQLIELLKKFF